MNAAAQTAESLVPSSPAPVGRGLPSHSTSPPRSPTAEAWRRLRSNRVAMAMLAYLIGLLIVAGLAPLWPLQSPYRVDTSSARGAAAIGLMENDMPLQGADGALDQRAQQNEFRDLALWQYPLLKLPHEIVGRRSVASICGTDELGTMNWPASFGDPRVAARGAGGDLCFAGDWRYLRLGGRLLRRADRQCHGCGLVDTLYSLPLIFIVIFLITFLNEPVLERGCAAGHRSTDDLFLGRGRGAVVDHGADRGGANPVSQTRALRRGGP